MPLPFPEAEYLKGLVLRAAMKNMKSMKKSESRVRCRRVAVANPFRPSFGNSPPVLAGRDELIEQFAEALDNGPGAPGRATLYTGARGTGKTVMLNEVADIARQRGWLVIEETASPGVVTRLVTPAPAGRCSPTSTRAAAGSPSSR